MNVINKVDSWNSQTNKDCFGLFGKSSIDHIWPLAKDGSNIAINKQRLSVSANGIKDDETSGYVNGYKFVVHKKTTKQDYYGNQDTYGIMYIRKDNWADDDWCEVFPVK